MRHVNVVIPDECHLYLRQRKHQLNLKTLDDVVARIILNDMKTQSMQSKAKIKEGKQ